MTLRAKPLLMKLQTLTTKELDWSLNFRPLKPWPKALPVIARGNKVLLGFERQNEGEINVLSIEGELPDLIATFYLNENLGSFEKLRLSRALGETTDFELLKWPDEFQDFIDSKQVALKNLKALTYLNKYKDEISEAVLKFKPSSSQIRELIDLLCDLTMSGRPWADCFNSEILNAEVWISFLKKQRYPLTSEKDLNLKSDIKNISWPKGVQAQNIRSGDQAGVAVSARVFSNHEWNKMRDAFSKIQLPEKIWEPHDS